MKANFVVSGISSVVGICAAGNIASLALGTGVTLSGGSALLLIAGLIIGGGMAGLAVADKFFGKGEENRSITNSATTALLSYGGYSVVSTALGVGGLFAGVATGSLALTVAGVTAGSLLGGGLGAAAGAAVANWLTANKIPPKDPAPAAAPAPA